MKKLDKLVFRAFLGPFFITFAVVVFIFLIRFLMQYFEEFVGKDLGLGVFAELFFYFGVNTTPQAYPLAVLLSCLIVFGNLGEHFELTAIKGAGISLLRSMRSIFVFVIILVAFAYYSNDQIVPEVNLKAYSLLYDIRKTKPGLDIKPGTFYDGLPDYSIKVSENEDDGGYLKDVIIYDHSRGQGNTDVIFAESGSMETFNNDKYMRLTLYNGRSFSEQDEASAARRRYEAIHQFARTEFDTTIMVFDLSSFDLEKTDQSLFSQHYKMKDTETLNHDIDSMYMDRDEAIIEGFQNIYRFYRFHMASNLDLPDGLAKENERIQELRYGPAPEDTVTPGSGGEMASAGALLAQREGRGNQSEANLDEVPIDAELITKPTTQELSEDELEKERQLQARLAAITEPDSALIRKVEALSNLAHNKAKIFKSAATAARYVKNNLNVQATKVENREARIRDYRVERGKKLSLAFSCLVMFLIGAPLGAIIKKGGLGMPLLIAIIFFIIFYVFMSGGEKWGKLGLVDPIVAVWLCNLVLLPFGFFFLVKARNDARLLENDFYLILWDRFRKKVSKKRKKNAEVVA